MAPDVTAVLLAGGMARRMGGINKGFRTLNGVSLAEHVLLRIRPQVNDIVISANDYSSEYETFGFPVFQDLRSGHLGPLSGIETTFKSNPKINWLFCCPIDTPFIPLNLVSILFESISNSDASCAVISHNGKIEPLHCLLHARLLSPLSTFLDNGGRSVFEFLEAQSVIKVNVSFSDRDFLNLNTSDELNLLNSLHG